MSDTRGFSLVEMMISAGLVAVAVLAATEFSLNSVRATKANGDLGDFDERVALLSLALTNDISCTAALKGSSTTMWPISSASPWSLSPVGLPVNLATGMLITKLEFNGFIKQDMALSSDGSLMAQFMNFHVQGVPRATAGLPPVTPNVPGISVFDRNIPVGVWVTTGSPYTIVACVSSTDAGLLSPNPNPSFSTGPNCNGKPPVACQGSPAPSPTCCAGKLSPPFWYCPNNLTVPSPGTPWTCS